MTILYIILINWALTGIFLLNVELYGENPGASPRERRLYALKYNISQSFLGIFVILISFGAYLLQNWLGMDRNEDKS